MCKYTWLVHEHLRTGCLWFRGSNVWICLFVFCRGDNWWQYWILQVNHSVVQLLALHYGVVLVCLGASWQEVKQDHGPYVSKNKNAFLEPACRFWCRSSKILSRLRILLFLKLINKRRGFEDRRVKKCISPIHFDSLVCTWMRRVAHRWPIGCVVERAGFSCYTRCMIGCDSSDDMRKNKSHLQCAH